MQPTLTGASGRRQIPLSEIRRLAHQLDDQVRRGQVLINDPNGLLSTRGGRSTLSRWTTRTAIRSLLHAPQRGLHLSGLPYRETLPGTTIDIGRSDVFFRLWGIKSFSKSFHPKGYAGGTWTGTGDACLARSHRVLLPRDPRAVRHRTG